MKDTIHLNGIRTWGKHGAFEGEKGLAQPFDIDVELTVDLSVPEASDCLSDTVDYSQIHKIIVNAVKTETFNLIEKLAGHILTLILSDPRIEQAQITIAKPQKLNGATASVTLRRMNSQRTETGLTKPTALKSTLIN